MIGLPPVGKILLLPCSGKWLISAHESLMRFNPMLYRLYDNHPNGNEELLIETMKLLKSTGDPWEGMGVIRE